ncbi:phytoene desaturase family protein [Cytophaga aurantiaca]|uniref:phytoene desaturase family protein n=1 Tax=Cytophaga aurantiaca TaxID=29530 RepID=UPI000363F7AF|nr:phytoene desaturase family protein [Cytophaga aurantiaca]
MKTIGIIGSGVSGLSAASVLALKGQKVVVFEKNDQLGGRMRQFEANGFTFDMGPSWYWMPDVFERFYNQFGHTSSDFYELKKLDPGFQIITSDGDTLKIPADWEELLELFEQIETGSADKLVAFMREAQYKYDVGVKKLIYQPGLSLLELINADTISGVFRLQVFSSFSKHVRSYFKNEKLIALMEFPVLFLGAMPKNTPALYSLMNYAGLKQGTYYPMGGFKKVIDAMVQISREHGVEFNLSEGITGIKKLHDSKISLSTTSRTINVDGLIASADYHHVESKLLQSNDRNYSENYWDKKVFAPSSLIFYIGVNKKLDKLEHHNLFFDADFPKHAIEIYEDPKWPSNPLFYVCCPSKTDPSVAPKDKENLFILMPIAPGIADEKSIRDSYYDLLLTRLEKYTGVSVRENIEYVKSYCVNDFIEDYNSYKGNAYGLANTLMQTANLKPKIKNKNIPNFYYCGQLTVPGPGVPPSIVSGQVAANELLKTLKVNI